MTRILKTSAAALFVAAGMAETAPAQAGGWQHRHAERVVIYEETPVPWYHQPPWVGTGVELYYSHYPHHVPGYPAPLQGLPVPIHDPAPPASFVAPAQRTDYFR